MNLKNSKFLKRIQLLRRLSNEKLRKLKERNSLSRRIQNSLHEPNGICCSEHDAGCDNFYVNAYKTDEREGGGGGGVDGGVADEHENVSSSCSNTSQYDLNRNKIHHSKVNNIKQINGTAKVRGVGGDCKLKGLIQLNNTCFHISGLSGSFSKKTENNETLPAVRNRGSLSVSNNHYSVVTKTAKAMGFKIVSENKLWNILWTDTLPNVELYKNMKRFQQINHFPGMVEICRKDLLSRNLNRMLKLYPNDYKIFPKTWVFPADYGEALNYNAAHYSKQKTFIIKPDASSQGRGIWLTNDLKNINPGERMICQNYINSPLLIDGYKFDLRIYALITSVDPLRIYVYNEGLVRLATSKYVPPNPDNSDNLFMHLTNYSLNKRNSQYELSDSDDCGSKRKFSAINAWMRSRNYDVDELWSNIDDVIIKTFLSAWPILKHNYHACFPGHDKIQACFEILGFDILIDSHLKPYILEVNLSPSLQISEAVDQEVKRPLIRDTLNLLSTSLVNKRQILREDKNRVKQRLLKSKHGFISNNIKTATQNADCPVGPLAQQIAWEESHMGEYRRVMPPQDASKMSYYCQFYGTQNQASIFAETASSKKREEQAKKLRLQIEEKRRKQTEMQRNHNSAVSFEERLRKRINVPRHLLDKHRQRQMHIQAHWSPGFISTTDERLRNSNMQLRTNQIKDLKIVEEIFTQFSLTDNLTESDISKFPDLYKQLAK